MIAELVRLVGKVVRVDADAMATDEPGSERQKIPLGSRGLKHLGRIDADPVKQKRELVHQRNVEIALRILDHFRGLGYTDGARPIHARSDDTRVNRRNTIERFRRVPRHDLGNAGQGVLVVARIDALGRIADKKIPLPLHPRVLLQSRNTDFLRRPRIDGRLEYHRRTRLEIGTHRGARAKKRAKVRLVRFVHRGWHGDDDKISVAQLRRISCEAQRICRAQRFGGHLAGGVDAFSIRGDLDG